jgi:hypothetical protein
MVVDFGELVKYLTDVASKYIRFYEVIPPLFTNLDLDENILYKATQVIKPTTNVLVLNLNEPRYIALKIVPSEDNLVNTKFAAIQLGFNELPFYKIGNTLYPTPTKILYFSDPSVCNIITPNVGESVVKVIHSNYLPYKDKNSPISLTALAYFASINSSNQDYNTVLSCLRDTNCKGRKLYSSLSLLDTYITLLNDAWEVSKTSADQDKLIILKVELTLGRYTSYHIFANITSDDGICVYKETSKAYLEKVICLSGNNVVSPVNVFGSNSEPNNNVQQIDLGIFENPSEKPIRKTIYFVVYNKVGDYKINVTLIVKKEYAFYYAEINTSETLKKLLEKYGFRIFVDYDTNTLSLAYCDKASCSLDELKKKAILFSLHCFLIFTTHSFSISLALGPLSPPTITQSIFVRLISPKSSNKGSIDRNKTLALSCLK